MIQNLTTIGIQIIIFFIIKNYNLFRFSLNFVFIYLYIDKLVIELKRKKKVIFELNEWKDKKNVRRESWHEK